MIQDSKEQGLESLLSFHMALEGNGDESLTIDESERNIYENIVNISLSKKSKDPTLPNMEIVEKGLSSGLLITTDGFIITAYHSIQRYENDWLKIKQENPPNRKNRERWLTDIKKAYYIIDNDGNRYPIDITLWGRIPRYDIAVIKALIPERPRPIKFRVLEGRLRKGDEVKLFGIRDEKPYNQYGRVTNENCTSRVEDVGKIENTFETDAVGVRGFSGGVFITMKGELAGLVVCQKKPFLSKSLGVVSGSSISNILELIKKTGYRLGKSHFSGKYECTYR